MLSWIFYVLEKKNMVLQSKQIIIYFKKTIKHSLKTSCIEEFICNHSWLSWWRVFQDKCYLPSQVFANWVHTWSIQYGAPQGVIECSLVSPEGRPVLRVPKAKMKTKGLCPQEALKLEGKRGQVPANVSWRQDLEGSGHAVEVPSQKS